MKAKTNATLGMMDGAAMYAFASRLYPYCRSITGQGVRQTLRDVAALIPLKLTECPTGRRVFDWEVPPEWNVEDAYVLDPHGKKIIDFQAHNLHLVSYSEPASTQVSLAELKAKTHVSAAQPDWIPYRTSYYKRDWGFCARANEVQHWQEGRYQVKVASRIAKGSLTYGEFVLPGQSKEEVLLFTHICHPSLANDNLSGIALATALAQWLMSAPRRYSYRIVFAPGTIGSLCWLKANESRLARVKHGLVLGLLGDDAPFTYKRSRRGDTQIDAIAQFALSELYPDARVIDFNPWGYDERQLCSPGFDLPVGRLTRSVNGGYPQYHSSGDDLLLIKPAVLHASLVAVQRIVEIVETNRRYLNLRPKGEPRLGKRGLYNSVGGRNPTDDTHAMFWMLSQSDGRSSLVDVARKAGLPYDLLRDAADRLREAKLLRETAGPANVTRRKARRR